MMNGNPSGPRMIRRRNWAPQEGPQNALVECDLPEVFFGGARGGGKTDGVLGKWAKKERLYRSAFNAMMFRRTMVASEDAIERSRELYRPLGAKLVDNVWRMPNGGGLGFVDPSNINDADARRSRHPPALLIGC